jgi:16S rRNA (adenine1518-N6/adenine1519-N6)-dimethyltransferase
MKRTKRKALGQHFLKNPFVLRKILRVISPLENELLVEIGPGKGALTFPLTQKAGKVIAIEKDKAFFSFLKERQVSNLELLEADVLKVDFCNLLEKETNFRGRVKLVGNLPYSISSPLLFKALGDRELFSECVFLLQKEVAERICGQPGSKRYAPLSILFQIYFSTHLHFYVSPNSFSPPPQVDSALISLKKRPSSLFIIENEELFYKFLRDAFKHRRKTLWNNLQKLGLSHSLLDEAFQTCALQRNTRAEQVSIAQFVCLFHKLFKKLPPDAS